MRLYHLTTPDAACRLRKEGLVPSIGERGAMCLEKENVICFCDAQSVPYWSRLLGLSVLFSVNSEDLDIFALIGRLKCNHCYEFRYTKPIPASLLKGCKPFKTISREKENWLCESYMSVFHMICTQFALYYLSPSLSDEGREDSREFLAKTVSSSLFFARNLDFSNFPSKMARASIRKYAFTDRCVVDKAWWDAANKAMPDYVAAFAERTAAKKEYRLYQMLKKYPNDEFTDLRRELYDFIVKTFRPTGCLDINTGSFLAN